MKAGSTCPPVQLTPLSPMYIFFTAISPFGGLINLILSYLILSYLINGHSMYTKSLRQRRPLKWNGLTFPLDGLCVNCIRDILITINIFRSHVYTPLPYNNYNYLIY